MGLDWKEGVWEVFYAVGWGDGDVTENTKSSLP